MQLWAASCLAAALLCYGKTRGKTGKEGDEKVTERQTEGKAIYSVPKTFSSSYSFAPKDKMHSSSTWPFRKGAFWLISAAPNALTNCERSSVLNAHLSLPEDSFSCDRCQRTAGSFYILLPCSIVARRKGALKPQRAFSGKYPFPSRCETDKTLFL